MIKYYEQLYSLADKLEEILSDIVDVQMELEEIGNTLCDMGDNHSDCRNGELVLDVSNDIANTYHQLLDLANKMYHI